MHRIFAYLSALFTTTPLAAETYESVRDVAKKLAATEYSAPSSDLPTWLAQLNYDSYRAIHFRPQHAIWGNTDSPFAIELLHPGYLFSEEVQINLDGEPLAYDDSLFDIPGRRPTAAESAKIQGYGGFRIVARQDDGSRREFAVFQGASYWRIVGTAQQYGISARGVALASGAEEKEEFPVFRRFWISRPDSTDRHITVTALLDSPSLTGVYEFTIRAGEIPIAEVRAELFARRDISRLGLAPMSSMFWYSPSFPRSDGHDDHPHVHDSDGLAILTKDGEAVWRPLTNERPTVELSVHNSPDVRGFGLVQRQRDADAFNDSEVAYERRPTLWIEPLDSWGEGNVVLVEIPTANEYVDNIVAMWEPKGGLRSGESRAFRYRQTWTLTQNPTDAAATVNQMNVTHPEDTAKIRTLVSFDKSTELSDVESFSLSVTSHPKIDDARIRTSFERIPETNRVWASCELTLNATPPNAGFYELRFTLQHPTHTSSETWLYRLHTTPKD